MDIKKIIVHAKSEILKGPIEPIVIVEYSDGAGERGYVLHDTPFSAIEQRAMFYDCGKRDGREHRHRSIKSILFMGFIWEHFSIETAQLLFSWMIVQENSVQFFEEKYQVLFNGDGWNIDLLFEHDGPIKIDMGLVLFYGGFMEIKIGGKATKKHFRKMIPGFAGLPD